MIALAFRGPNAISYDAWERGMARAATMVTVREVLPLLESIYGAGTIDVADPLWHALDRYDLLNQPLVGPEPYILDAAFAPSGHDRRGARTVGGVGPRARRRRSADGRALSACGSPSSASG